MSSIARATVDEVRTWVSRTGIPLLVAVLVGWLAGHGIHLPGPVQALVTSGIGAAAGFLYALAVHLAERKWPFLSVLLGSKQQPTYKPAATPPTAPTGGAS